MRFYKVGGVKMAETITYRFSLPRYLYAYIRSVSNDRGCTVSDTIRFLTGIQIRGCPVKCGPLPDTESRDDNKSEYKRDDR
jgi:hypothetical protein